MPIPPYLLALAVGRLESRELSHRSRVWSEPSVVDAAAYEFAHTADYLDAGMYLHTACTSACACASTQARIQAYSYTYKCTDRHRHTHAATYGFAHTADYLDAGRL